MFKKKVVIYRGIFLRVDQNLGKVLDIARMFQGLLKIYPQNIKTYSTIKRIKKYAFANRITWMAVLNGFFSVPSPVSSFPRVSDE